VREEKDMLKLNRSLLAGLAVTSLLYAGSGVRADDDRDRDQFKARLQGFNEVPAISSTGTGRFRARILDDSSIVFELTYEDLEGTTTTAAHVHLGNKSDAGGVSYFLCGGGGRPACTPTSGTFTGTVTAADIIGPVPQGIAAGEFEEVLRAMRAGVTYANVHTNKHPGGEIRGQLRSNRDDDD
jgi:CHRD domain-containing protein